MRTVDLRRPRVDDARVKTGPAMYRRGAAAYAVVAVVAYAPLLATGRGIVNADTKSYLYIDPARLLARAASLWDPSVGMGTVSHQIIGYLWPMGPFFWVAEWAGIPDWFAQRVWLGTIIAAAGAGVLFLLRRLGIAGPAAVAGAFVYMLSPYLLVFASRMSALLLPWAGLPWLLALTVLAARRGGWRHPALFALVTVTIGSINATALLFALVGALAWLPFAVFVTRETTLRRAASVLGRVATLTALVNAWWAVALVIGGRYGVPVLEATETLEATATSSTATEVVRGLGNWFFYGGDRLGPWVEAAAPYAESLPRIAVSFAVPVTALAVSAGLVWRRRAFFAGLVFLGVVIAVGAYPYRDPSPFGRLLKLLADSSTFGLALRNSGRAVPLVVLGLAALLAGALAAAARRRPTTAAAAAAVVALLALANLPALWDGSIADRNLSRPEDLPEYWLDAAAWLDARGNGTRVLEIPGSDFASYRWGNTIDPITPGLIDRPWVARELVPVGTVPSVDLLAALDRRMQEGVLEPSAIAPIARLIGAGDVVLRSDLQFERYRTPRPRRMWDLLTPPPPGLHRPVTFGPVAPNRPTPLLPMLDEIELGLPPDAADPPPVAAFPVVDPTPIVRTRPAGPALLVAGDGEGLVELAATGGLGDRLIRYSGSLTDAELRRAAREAELVLTDSNRRRARRFMLVRENYGYTEQAGERPLVDDPFDARLRLFPDVGDAARTVAQYRGVRRVQATDYGNIVSYVPEDRPVNALDGRVETAWRVGAFTDPVGELLEIELDSPVMASHLTLVQPVTGPRNRWITRAALRFDGRDRIASELGDASRSPAGQVVKFPPRKFRRLEIEVTATNTGRRADNIGLSAVGFAEVGIPGVTVEELLRLPTRLLHSIGDAAATRPLTVLLSRSRADAAEPVRSDEDPALARTFTLPYPRTFRLSGTARISPLVDDRQVDAILGRPGADGRGTWAQSNARLPGSLTSRASAALDGDLATWWSPGLLEQEGNAIEIGLGREMTVDHLETVLVTDGRHSVPTRLIIEMGGESRVVELGPFAADRAEAATTTVPVRFAPLTGSTLRLQVDEVEVLRSLDWYSDAPIALPVAIAELGIPGIHVDPLPSELPGTCRDDLLAVDGRAVPVKLVGRTADAEQRIGVDVVPCTGTDLMLGAGDHDVTVRPGWETGIDIDRLLLRSAGAGRTPVSRPPAVAATDRGRTAMRIDVSGAAPGEPFWLVLGQSHSRGWDASIDGNALAGPELVDGFANGWLIDAPSERFSVDLAWTPQSAVDTALRVSAAAAVLCLGIVVVSFARRRPFVAGIEDDVPVTGVPVPMGTRRSAVVATVGTLAVGLAVAPVSAAGAAAAVVAAAGFSGRLRVVALLAPAALVAAAAVYVIGLQERYRFAADFPWGDHFHRVHPVTWAAILAFAGLALLEGMRAR